MDRIKKLTRFALCLRPTRGELKILVGLLTGRECKPGGYFSNPGLRV